MAEGRGHGAVRLDVLEFVGAEVAGFERGAQLGVQRGQRFTQALGSRLAADGDRAYMVKRVVVHADALPETGLHQALLEARGWLVEHVRVDVGGEGGRFVLRGAGAVPLDLHGDGVHVFFNDDAAVLAQGRDRRTGARRNGSAPRGQLPKVRSASANIAAASTSPLTISAELFGT